MSILGSHILPSDVRQVIDRTDLRLENMIERLAVISDLLDEQNALTRELLRRLK